jgi:hypothetical protein
VNAERTQRCINVLIWFTFALALVAATSPIWQRMLLGFNPTLDDVLQIALCRSRL